MKYFINQTTSSDCGYACVKMILARFHHNKNYLISDETFENMSFYEMKKILLKHHIDAIGVKVDKDFLNKKFNNSIIQIIENTHKHFVILKKVGNKEMTILDPSNGERIIEKNYFFDIFTGFCLLVNSFEKEKKKDKPMVKTKIYSFSFLISLFIDIGIIYFKSYLVKDSYNILISVLLLIAILINFLFKITLILKLNSQIYKKIFTPLIEKKCPISELKNIIQYRSLLVQNLFKKISYVVILLFGIVILIKNSIYFSITILILSSFILFDKCILSKTLIRIIEKNNILENNYVKNTKDSFKKINHNSNIFVIMKICYYVLLIISITIFYLVYNEINQIHSLLFVIFNTFLNISLFEITNKFIFCLTKEKIELRNYENKTRILLKKYKI